MSVELNHTLVYSRNKSETAEFLSEVLGLPKPEPFGIFMVVRTANGVNLDCIDGGNDIASQHYAFLVSEKEFDEIFGRIKSRGLKYWADPGKRIEGRINTHDGGRGVYFPEPSGHLLEIITKPYGADSE